MRKALLTLTAVLALCACSTTRVLQEGEYRLASNKVKVVGDRSLSPSEISPYIKQQSNNSAFFTSVYNMSNGRGGAWDRLAQRIGEAPVVFDPALVDDSRRSICDHLEYIGLFNSSVQSVVDTVGRKVKVSYLVTPGRHYPLESITYVLPEGEFRTEFCADTVNSAVRTGTYLAESVLEAESSRSADYFRDLGYYTLSKNNYFFTADTLAHPGFAQLEYRISGYTRGSDESDGRPLEKYTVDSVSIPILRTSNSGRTCSRRPISSIPATCTAPPRSTRLIRGSPR